MLLIPLAKSHYTHQFRDQGYVIEHDPPGDENCQFSAICFGSSQMEIFRSAETLRSDVVNDLRNIDKMNGAQIDLFAEVPIEQYLYEMSLEGTCGDESLRAIADIFNVEVVVISTLAGRGRVNILPQYNVPLGRLLSGHLAESLGKHYVSLEKVD